MLRKIALRLFLSSLSAILLILSFPDFNLWILAWFGFVPLFVAIRGESKLRAFLFSYLTGVIFWSGTIYWLVHVTLLGTVLLILYLALYFGIFGFVFASPYLLSTHYYLLFLPSCWVLLEYLRAHLLTGFPWALLGYSQYLNLPVIQIADITGVWGVSFLVMLVNVVILRIACRSSHTERMKRLLPALLCVVIVLAYGYYQLYWAQEHKSTRAQIKISVIQGNIPQELKWADGSERFILERYSELSRKAALDDPDLIVWPEAAVPGVLGEDGFFFARLYALAREINSPLLIGALAREKGEYFNSALFLDEKGEIAGRYDKLHLVPFGEYIPLKNIFPFLETVAPIGDINRGKEYRLFSLKGVKFGALICFEDLFPELSKQFVRQGAGFLVNITNDAWYKKTSAARQHLQASVFRAVENRVNLVRSANTGVSGFILPSGRILSLVKDAAGREIFISGLQTEEILVTKDKPSVYTRIPGLFIIFCLLFVLYGIILKIKNAK